MMFGRRSHASSFAPQSSAAAESRQGDAPARPDMPEAAVSEKPQAAPAHASPELERRVDGHRPGHSYARNGRKCRNGLPSDPAQRPPGFGEDGLAEVKRRAAVPARPEQDRQQLGRTECRRPEVQQPLARAVGPRKLSNS